MTLPPKNNILGKSIFLILFLACLILELTAITFEWSQVRYFTKPLLIPLLAGFVITSKWQNRLSIFLLLALLFSWMGDVLLLFESNNANFFLFGLGSFLLAHVFYILFFYRLRVKQKIRPRWWFLIPVGFYYLILVILLYPNLGDMRVPVLVYGIVISLMLWQALHFKFTLNRQPGWRIITGAALFVLSDSVLAINKFLAPFDTAAIIIMFTYGFAQYYLVLGSTGIMNNLITNNE